MIYEIETKSGEIFSVEIKKATATEIPGLTDINNRWQKEMLGNDITRGFLSASFSYDIFKLLVESNEVVVAILDDKVVGYYLVNSISSDGVLFKHSHIVDALKLKAIIPYVNVGLGSQALVEKDFQGSKIRKLMLNELVKLMKDKYQYLFSTISKQNTRAFSAHTKDGWTVVDEDEDTHHVILDLKLHL
jgi:hypothetical protein